MNGLSSSRHCRQTRAKVVLVSTAHLVRFIARSHTRRHRRQMRDKHGSAARLVARSWMHVAGRQGKMREKQGSAVR
jgi:hypothetical protein